MLTAAARLFGTQRFHEVRMQDIAAEAAVGKGTLYRYFNDKEELYAALLGQAATQVGEQIDTCLAGTTGARRQLEAVVAALIAFFDEQPHLFDLIQRAEVLQRRGGEFPWQAARDRIGATVLGLFKRAKEQNEFVVRDPDTALWLLLGGLRGVMRFGRRPRPRDLARRVVASFLDGASA